MYYGNSSTVSDASLGQDVFEFFDDFEGSSLDNSVWTTTGEGSVAVSGGYVYPSDYGSGVWHGPAITVTLPTSISDNYRLVSYVEHINTGSNGYMGKTTVYMNDDGNDDNNGVRWDWFDAWSGTQQSALDAYANNSTIYDTGAASTYNNLTAKMQLFDDGTDVHFLKDDSELGLSLIHI